MTNYAIQEQNQDLVSLLAAHFRLLYNPVFGLTDAISMYMQLPGLIAFWPGSVGTVTNAANLRDVSNSGVELTRSGLPQESAENTSFRRWVEFDGVDDFFYTADTAYLSIQGNEGALPAANRGLTILGWVQFDTSGNMENILAKWLTTGNQRSYRLVKGTSNAVNLQISSDGTASVTTAANALTIGNWTFIAGRYIPSTEIRAWKGDIDGLENAVNTTSIPATIFDSTADLMVGARESNAAPAEFLDGGLSLLALCRAAVPSQFINAIFQMTAPLFINNI